MGVTRIRYLLDQWRLRSVAVGFQNPLEKHQPAPGWQIPALKGPKPPDPANPDPPAGPPSARP